MKQKMMNTYLPFEGKISSALYDFLCTTGYNPKYGARALQRTLREVLIVPLAHQLNQYGFDEKLVIEVDIQEGNLVIDIEADPLKLELMLEEVTQNEYMTPLPEYAEVPPPRRRRRQSWLGSR